MAFDELVRSVSAQAVIHIGIEADRSQSIVRLRGPVQLDPDIFGGGWVDCLGSKLQFVAGNIMVIVSVLAFQAWRSLEMRHCRETHDGRPINAVDCHQGRIAWKQATHVRVDEGSIVRGNATYVKDYRDELDDQQEPRTGKALGEDR